MAATPKTPRATARRSGGSGGRWAAWLAPNPGKRWTELFFLAYSPSWILWCLCWLVPFKIYEVRRQRGPETALRPPGTVASPPACPPARLRMPRFLPPM